MLCVDLIDTNTLKGKDGTVIDFMALTMVDPATSWFKIVELPLVRQLKAVAGDGKESSIVEEIFDKSSNCIVQLFHKTWLNIYAQCSYLIYNNGSEFKLNFKYLVNRMVLAMGCLEAPRRKLSNK